jgi:dTDP-4-dehydrorhamnose reductase
MSTILVTGANGQLGSEIRFLAERNAEFSFTFLERNDLSITDELAVNHFFQAHHFDYLIHCAAYTAVDKAESEQELAYLVNKTAVVNLAKACKSNNIKMVHISTDFVFDGNSSIPLIEESKTNPLSVYGATKLAGEEAASAVNKDLLIIRTSWVYSTFGNNFAKTIIRLCKERDKLNIIFDQVGTPTYARDLAAAILTIIKTNQWQSGIYHYSNEGVASWYDFAVAIKEICGLTTTILPIETSEYPTPATRPKYSVLNKKKIKKTFGLNIPYWRDSLKTCITELNKQ